jgi:cysteine sulfinate desulfinase/cysteine desulfurase-like protein
MQYNDFDIYPRFLPSSKQVLSLGKGEYINKTRNQVVSLISQNSKMVCRTSGGTPKFALLLLEFKDNL